MSLFAPALPLPPSVRGGRGAPQTHADVDILADAEADEEEEFRKLFNSPRALSN